MRVLCFPERTPGLLALLLVPVFFTATCLAQTRLAPVTLLAGATAVGKSAPAVLLSLTITGSGTASTPAAVTTGIATQGAAASDFTLAAGGTCVAGQLYLPGQQCTLAVVFQPQFPGLRTGAVVLRATDGSLLASALVSGRGTGPLPVLPQGRIDTVAGTTEFIFRGDGGPAIISPIFLPTGVVTDVAGNLYLSDSGNNRIRRVDAVTGIITTVAGTGTGGYTSGLAPGTQSAISTPGQITIDGAGDLYFADTGNHIIRRLDAVTGLLSTVAGQAGSSGYAGDTLVATSALLSAPQGLALDAAGNLFIADTGNSVIRRVDASSGIITTVAGTGAAGFTGDGNATSQALNSPWNLALGPDGSLYIADQANHRIRRLDNGTLTTVAGFAQRGFAGDNGPATSASLNFPESVAVDPAGDLYIADTSDNAIRFVNAATGIITSLIGPSAPYFGEGGPANLANIYGPDALHVDAAGDLYLADLFHNRVRRISASAVELDLATQKVGKLSAPQPVPFLNAGNAPLTEASPVFSQATLDAATTICQVGVPLATSATCNLGAVFLPTLVGSGMEGTITVASDARNPAPVITLRADVLSVNPTSVALSSSLNPALVGQAVTFTATVISDDTGRTGTVTFSDGSTPLCKATLSATGTATCTPAAMTLGSHPISAVYSGDTNNAGATSALLTQVVKQSASPLLTVTPNPSTVAQAVTLSVTVTADTGTPTGVATFYDGTTALGSANLTGGTATFTTSTLTAGTHSLTVQYAGDAGNAAATSNTISEGVQQASTTTTLQAGAPSADAGVSLTFTATVTSANGPAPTGTVTFFDGATALITAPLTGGVATFSTATFAPGAHSITAVYSGDADDATSTSAAQLETVRQITTVTALAADVNPVSAGGTLHLTATVTAASSTGGALGGSVTFLDGNASLGTAPLDASGRATLAIGTLAPGGHALVARFTGSTSYAASVSAPLSETVQQTATATVLASLTNPTLSSQVATFTATVSSATGTPTGQVTFLDGGVLLGTATLNAAGTATLATGKLAVGNHNITATYVTDGFYTGSSSTALVQIVNPAGTTVALASSGSPATLATPVTFTAAISSSSTGATGTVTFSDGPATLGSASLVNGTATFTISTLAFGPHSITALYSGDTSHLGATSVTLSELIVQGATMTLTSSLNPAAAGNPVVFAAKVLPVNGVMPTGTVVFRDGSTPLGTATLDATGSATFSTSTLAVGPHTIAVSFAGDTDYAGGSATLLETIQNSSVQMALTASANPATYGAPLMLTAVITTNGAVATGPVTFNDGTTPLGTATLDATGTAVFATRTLTSGPHVLTAVYAGDGKAGAGSSSPLPLVVEQVTTLTLASSANPSPTLSPITLTASVGNAGFAPATGTVLFTDGSTQLGSATLTGGAATLTLPQLSAGVHTVTASYAGDPENFPGASAPLTETVNLRPTSTTLSATSTDPKNPQQVLLIGVAHASGPVPATGTITFASGGTTLGSAAIDPTGVATLSVNLNSGAGTITAVYSGDASYATSTSAATPVKVGEPTQFSLALSPSAMTLPTTRHGTATLSIASVSGFADTLEFGCLGLPFAATCTFSSPTGTLTANGTISVNVVIDTGDPLGAGSSAALHPLAPGLITFAFLPAAFLPAAFLLRRRRRALPLLLAAFAMALTLTTTGCGGLTIHGTPAGTYSFKITAAGQGSGATQSQTMTLTVTQ